MSNYVAAFVLLLFLCFPESLLSQEYIPHAKLSFKTPTELRAFSGVVIDSPEDTITVLTCWHGTMGFSSPKTITVQLFQPTVDNTQLSAILQLRVIKFNPDKDILLLSSPNTLKLKIKKLKIATNQLLPNVETKSYGYADSIKLIENNSRIIDYNSMSVGGSSILYVNALVVSGMSGGGLLRNEMLYGIQSVGGNNKVGYCPADQILIFLKE